MDFRKVRDILFRRYPPRLQKIEEFSNLIGRLGAQHIEDPRFLIAALPAELFRELLATPAQHFEQLEVVFESLRLGERVARRHGRILAERGKGEERA